MFANHEVDRKVDCVGAGVVDAAGVATRREFAFWFRVSIAVATIRVMVVVRVVVVVA